MTILFMGGILSGQKRTASDGTERLFVRVKAPAVLPFGVIANVITSEHEYSDTGEKTPCGTHVFEFCEKRTLTEKEL